MLVAGRLMRFDFGGVDPFLRGLYEGLCFAVSGCPPYFHFFPENRLALDS